MNNNHLLYILLLIFIIKFIFTFIIEGFFNFKNIPVEYHSNSENINGIPKIIHHICPKDYRRWNSKWFTGLESWLRLYPEPEYTHMYWYDDELDKFIETEFPWFLDIFNAYDKNIKRIDMVRPFFLYKYGGIYSDMDYVVYKNFFDEVPSNIVSIPESPYKDNEFIQNALMISPPKNIFWLIIIDNCYQHRFDHVFSATGPQLFTQTYLANPELVNILPADIYNPHIADNEAFNASHIYAKHLLSTVW